MKTTKENLLASAKTAARATDKRSTVPILSCLLLESHQITGCDLSRQIVASLPEPIEGLEPVAVPAAKLVNILSALPRDAGVTLKQESDSLIVKSGRSRFKLSAMPAADYPSYDLRGEFFELSNGPDVVKAFSDLDFACPKDDVRHYLNGMAIEHSDGVAGFAAATDGRRMSARTFDGSVDGVTSIVPISAVEDITALFGNGDGSTVKVSHRMIQVERDGVSYRSNLIEGRYPDWRKIVPMPTSTYIVDREALMSAIKQAEVTSNEKVRGGTFTFKSGAGMVVSHNPERDELQAEFDCTTSDQELEFGMSLVYLMDALKAVTSETVSILMDGPGNPLLIREGDDLHVVMPMRM